MTCLQILQFIAGGMVGYLIVKVMVWVLVRR